MAGTEPHAWGTGRMDDITYGGLDVHKATVCGAVAESRRSGEYGRSGFSRTARRWCSSWRHDPEEMTARQDGECPPLLTHVRSSSNPGRARLRTTHHRAARRRDIVWLTRRYNNPISLVPPPCLRTEGDLASTDMTMEPQPSSCADNGGSE